MTINDYKMTIKYSLFTIILLSLATACKESVIDEGILPFVTPTSTDANGGNWRTVVLASAADVAVPAPTAVASAAYQN